MTSLCIIALRNKTVAHTFLPSFDNENGRLYQDSEFGHYGNVTSHFSLLCRLNLKVEKELVNFQLFAGNIEKIKGIKNTQSLGCKNAKLYTLCKILIF